MKNMCQWVVIFTHVSHLLDFDMNDVVIFDTKYFFLNKEFQTTTPQVIQGAIIFPQYTYLGLNHHIIYINLNGFS